MQAHHARIFRVKGFITSPAITEDVFRHLSNLSSARGVPLVVSAFRYCPEGMLGVEQISRELSGQLPHIDHVFVPVGGGGLFSAVCQGFKLQDPPRPRVHAVQPEKCSTVVAAFERGDNEIRRVEGSTQISGLSVPFDIDASLALGLLRECNGTGFGIEDDEVFEAQRQMLSTEGIYCEPAGAAALAGLRRAVQKEIVRPDETIVCLVTGHGFKDPDSIRRVAANYSPVVIEAGELERVLSEVG
jgi:threonine synthase